MKKIALILVIILSLTLALSGCATQYKISFYIGDELVREYKVDSMGTVNQYDPMLAGYQLIGWQEAKSGEVTYDFTKPVYKNVTLYAKFADAFTNESTYSPNKLTEVEVKEEIAKFGEYGKVTKAYTSNVGVYVVAEGYFGYHMDENPSMTVGVAFNKEGKILSAQKLGASHQSEGYAEMITPQYLNLVYNNVNATTTDEFSPSTGATATSKAVNYAVWTASNYADKAFSIKADTSDAQKVILAEAFKAEYETTNISYEVDKAIGQVLYAANGVNEKGEKVLGLIVKGAVTVSSDGGVDAQDWGSTLPNSSQVAIVISLDTNKVVGIKLISDGAKKPEYFEVPSKNLEAYKSVEIKAEDAFDAFKGGLVTSIETDINSDGDMPVITGTSIIYTGATANGTYTSQVVRNAFKTAARFYLNNK